MSHIINHNTFCSNTRRKIPCIVYYKYYNDKRDLEVSEIMEKMRKSYPFVLSYQVKWLERPTNEVKRLKQRRLDVMCYKNGRIVAKVSPNDETELHRLFKTVHNDSINNFLPIIRMLLKREQNIDLDWLKTYETYELSNPSYIITSKQKISEENINKSLNINNKSENDSIQRKEQYIMSESTETANNYELSLKNNNTTVHNPKISNSYSISHRESKDFKYMAFDNTFVSNEVDYSPILYNDKPINLKKELYFDFNGIKKIDQTEFYQIQQSSKLVCEEKGANYDLNNINFDLNHDNFLNESKIYEVPKYFYCETNNNENKFREISKDSKKKTFLNIQSDTLFNLDQTSSNSCQKFCIKSKYNSSLEAESKLNKIIDADKINNFQNNLNETPSSYQCYQNIHKHPKNSYILNHHKNIDNTNSNLNYIESSRMIYKSRPIFEFKATRLRPYLRRNFRKMPSLSKLSKKNNQ